MRGTEKTMYASVKPTEELLALFERAEALDADGLGRAGVLERAERYMVENKNRIQFRSLSKTRSAGYQYAGSLPSSFKVRIQNTELDAEVNQILKDAYQIKRIMTPFKLRLVLAAYIDHLEHAGIEADVTAKERAEDMDSRRVKAISLLLHADEKTLTDIIKRLQGRSRWT